MKKNKLLILCLCLAVLLVGASVLYNNLKDQVDTAGFATVATTEAAEAESETDPGEEVDYSAPDFTVLDWDGEERKLSEFEGKPVILNFWASWCGPCKMEMPEFEDAYKKYADDVHFVMVNCTGMDSMEDAKTLIEENGYTFPVYFDTTNEAAYTYGASSIPLTYFIDGSGNLVTYARGALSGEMLQKGIDMIHPSENTQ